jgi:hypothetical protein
MTKADDDTANHRARNGTGRRPARPACRAADAGGRAAQPSAPAGRGHRGVRGIRRRRAAGGHRTPGRSRDRHPVPALPHRLDLQEEVFRTQVSAVCAQGDELADSPSPGEAFAGWLRVLADYLATKRGLASALVAARGKDAEMISACSQIIRGTAEHLLARAQQAGAVRDDLTATDIMMLVHGVAVATERTPEQADRLLSLTLDGLRTRDPA